jgi:SAM-dependent methyltransferase
MNDARQYAPATDRNRQPILEVLQQVLPPTGTVLEISSGTGEHAVFFAPRLQPRHWIPSDPSPEARASIAAWQQQEAMLGRAIANLSPPIALDASAPRWAVEDQEQEIGAIVNINMIHIAPWSACQGLVAGAGRILAPDGVLYLYGPYKRNGAHTAPSNADFDESLRSRNPEWGVRNLETVIAEAQGQGLHLNQIVEMPANNLSVVFQKLH